ncbi:tryptophan synthase beta subunit-like PLP-dependent enzyme [Hyaloraphidium curvatum]|nr:tryptophan synthase beta subunit-like PLP-dependent enzyme [Hyaloraphidium curvatum]
MPPPRLPAPLGRHVPRRTFLPPCSRAFATAPPWRPPPVCDGLDGAVGRTPLLLLKTASRETGRLIYGKAEFMNPGGSVKDRAALALVLGAEQRGDLKPGGTVVEGTAGNTGIGLAHVCRARGYRLVVYMPDTQSREKVMALKVLGADVREVPAVAITDPKHYNFQAKEHADELNARHPGTAFFANQFDNADNAGAHFATTGPEIWSQLGGKLDAFVCATGTGGTLAGTVRYLKEASAGGVKCFLADPPGSVLHNYVQDMLAGTPEAEIEIRRTPGGSITEGIGQGRITANMRTAIALMDGSVMIPDAATIREVYSLLDRDGIFVGASSALNVAAAREVATMLPEGSSVATVVCDGGGRYQSRLFSRSWLEGKGLWGELPEGLQKYASLP